MSGRKPHLVVMGTKEPRQRIWESIRLLRPAFSINDIARRSGQHPNEIGRYFQALSKAGIIQVVEQRKAKEGFVYSLIQDEGADHPRLDSKGRRTYTHLATENIWRSLRILSGEVTDDDVVATASVGGVSLSLVKVRQYLNALVEAGYLTKKAGVGTTPDTYSMVTGKNTGPRPPEIRKLESLQVYDPNLSQLVYARTTGSIDADRSLVEPGVALLRSRELLTEWLAETSRAKGAFSPSSDLVQRTQLELATPGDSGGLQ
ncbi:hypothetical protein LOY64_07240 [Pseudomonas corrugata]|uniref:HTH iclR-type domain-containing protein n=1 Tax=Pseudomonas corrugata TaxID=47879 RepID=A0A8B6UUQ7_9PSED|nr:hypothetical protein [Pseudomonas corrugata]MDU9022139.1 hypothetical protein [Pseudomonas corrugata]QTH15634.1 hypothetical protein C4C32_06975 [Pseudomonas corrugata]UZD96792.1 hypothetical protein LOY64_07240 [Pseudomonas corrugata]